MDMIKLGNEVAAELGDSYEVARDYEINDRSVQIKDRLADAQFTISLTHDMREKRITIDGRMPRTVEETNTYGGCYGTITVTDKSTASRIAGEIRRRLLDEYRDAFNAAVPRRDSHNKFVADKKAALERFAAMVPGAKVKGEEVDFKMGNDDQGYFRRFQVSPTTVHLEWASIPLDLAEKLIALYNEHGTK